MKNYLMMIVLSAVLAGCASKKYEYDNETGSSPVSINGTDSVYEGGGSYNGGGSTGYNEASNGNFFDDPAYGKNVIGGPKSPAKDRVIYFSFDSSQPDVRSNSIIDAHANYLKQNSRERILLEGHTDELGSREYNIALGERRAISILKALTGKGVAAKQIRIISYGEENPAVRGYDESAYQRNRRVVIQYTGKE